MTINNKKYKIPFLLATTLLLGGGQALAQSSTTIEKELDDVVIQVAYGSAKKSTLTGAVSQIESTDIEKRPATSITSALEGTVAGVQVNNTFGQPGSSPSIIIRGFGTVNGGNGAPLYIIDGVAFGGNPSDLDANDIESISVLKDAASCALYGNRASNGVVLITTKKGKGEKMHFNLNIKQGSYALGMKDYKTLNANQFMEASWMSLRNARMTSKGEDAATAGAFANEHLISDELYLSIYENQVSSIPGASRTGLFDENGKLLPTVTMQAGYADDLNWIDQATRTGYRQEYNLSGSQATEKSDYYFSLGYLDEKGYLKNSGFDRLNGRVNLNFRPNRWIKAGINLSGSHQNIDYTTGDNTLSLTNIFYTGRFMAPIYPVHLHDASGNYLVDSYGNKQYDTGSYIDADGNSVTTRMQYPGKNTIWENELNKNRTVRNTGEAIAYMDVNFLNDFTFTVKGDLNLRSDKNTTYYNSSVGDGLAANGRLQKREYSYKNYTFQQQMKWAHTFGDHTLSVLLGHENYSLNYDYTYLVKSNEALVGSTNLTNFATMEQEQGYTMRYRTESYLGRVRYNYLDRYNVEASFRRDGSSRFAKGSRWGTFGSIGANWIVSKETFMKNLSWVNFLKLRADWGQVGNDAGASYNAYKSLYSSALTYEGNPAYIMTQIGNDQLKWETGESWGIGVEARLFNRWNLNMEYFDRKNKDLLFNVYNPLSAGSTNLKDYSSTITQNLGTIANRGFEISTDVDIFRNKDWRVNLSANATFIKNKVTQLPEQNKDGIIDGEYKIEEGKSRFEFYTYTYVGVDQMTGKALYKADLENYKVLGGEDGKQVIAGNPEGTDISKEVVCINGNYYVNAITHALKEYHGSAMPTVYGSFCPTVSYKSITFSALFTYSLGGKVYDDIYRQLMTTTTTPHNYHEDIMKSWNGVPEGMTEDSPHRIWANGVPQINSNESSDNNAISSRWLTSANYLVLKNLYLSYDLPKEWTRAIYMEGIRVNLSCENVFTSTKRRGMNPQQSINGYQYNYLMTPRVFTIGIDVKF